MAAENAAIKKSKIFGFVLARISPVSNFTGINQATTKLENTTDKILKTIFQNDFQTPLWFAVIISKENI